MPAAGLFHNREDVALADDGIFLSVHLHLGARIFAGDDLVACFDVHHHVLALDVAAGSNSDHFRHLGLLLGRAGRMMPLFVVSSASTILITTRSARGLIVIIRFLLKRFCLSVLALLSDEC